MVRIKTIGELKAGGEEHEIMVRAQPPRAFKEVSVTKAQKRAFERAERNYTNGNFVTLDVLRRDLAHRR